MKSLKLCALAFAIAAIAAPAVAADMPVKARPIVAPVYNWSGWYFGGNVGYSWGYSNTDVVFLDGAGIPIAPLPLGSTTSGKSTMDGWIGGGQLGANWQSGQWLVGIEADIQWSGQRGSTDFLCASTGVAGGPCLGGVTAAPVGFPGAILTLEQKLLWFGTVRGRLGVLPSPTWLLYVTGGFAYGEVESVATLTSITPAAIAATTTNSVIKGGWTVGGGIEGVISGPWTGKIEYLYMDLGTVSGAVALPAPAVSAIYSSRITDNIVRVGLNYRFWANAPAYRM